jgi:molybdenum cofactor synthesis domain-containing protein
LPFAGCTLIKLQNKGKAAPCPYIEMIKVAVLTLSDKGSIGQREDTSGPAIEKLVKNIDAEVVSYDILPDEKSKIKTKLISLCKKADLILTTGGTGVSPRDVTPDATREVIKYEIPGIAEAMRYESLKKTPRAMISRAVAGVRGNSLIINLPGSPKAVKENLEVILPVLTHTIEKIKGGTADCADI